MSTERGAHNFLIVLLVIAIVLLAIVFRPFMEALLLAAVIAAALHPFYGWVTKKLRYRGTLSAALVTLFVIIAVLLPLGSLTGMLVREVIDVTKEIAGVVQSEGLEGVVRRLPTPIQRYVARHADRFPETWTKLQSSLVGGSGKVAALVSGLLQTTGTALFQTVMMLIALFFFLIDGRKLVGWLEAVSPLGDARTHELFHEFRLVSVSVLVSTIATAGVQAIVAFFGYLIAGVPNPVFVALLTFFVAFIPSIGGGGAGVIAALYLLATGHVVAAVFLTVWATLVVGLSDNVVKPLLIRGGVEIHGGIIFFALLGGLAAFGPIGLLLGPLSVSFFLALVRLYRRDESAQAEAADLPLSRIQARPDKAPPAEQHDRH